MQNEGDFPGKRGAKQSIRQAAWAGVGGKGGGVHYTVQIHM